MRNVRLSQVTQLPGYPRLPRGFVSGLLFRIGAIFRAIGHFDLRQAGALISRQKLDGTQAT